MKNRISFQRIIYFVLIVAFMYAVYSYRDQLTAIVEVLSRGVWYALLAATGILVVVIYNQASLYASVYELLELPSRKERLLSLYLITRFVGVVAPSGGLSAWLPFIQDARRRNLGVGTVVVANLIYMILWYSAVSFFLVAGLLSLFLAHDLQWFEISAAILLLIGNIAMMAGLVFAGTAPDHLKNFLQRLIRFLNNLARWINRPTPIRLSRVFTFVDDLHNAVAQILYTGWHPLLRPIGHALLHETLNLAILFTLATAFALHLGFGVLVAAYSISSLFFIISPTPGGLGFVEGTVILVLTSLGVPKADATVLTLAYRGLTFWLPFILGFVALRWAHPEPVPEDLSGH